ncbi:hypothetical protein MKX03_034614 [Papaver bracteatum]|nr:hypothetical protein MKX03_034614 [Papaver bracteatum]
MAGKCSYGERCKFLHQWFVSDDFRMLKQLDGHEKKAITGIALVLTNCFLVAKMEQPQNEMLFAGTQNGSILVWKFVAVTNGFEPAAALRGHSASDFSWRATLQCIYILTDHTSVIMYVLCRDQFLLSCSLDKTIKVWALTESGKLKVTCTHNEEDGLLSLSGMPDAQEEIRATQTALSGLFFTGDGNGDLKVWKWTEQSTAAAEAIQR